MKFFSILFYLFGISFFGFAQDTIHFMDKSIKVVKLEEIGLTEIKYHSFINPDGPIYISNKNEIEYIRFSNGSIETIKHSDVQPMTPDITGSRPVGVFIPGEKIIIRGSKLSYAGKGLGESRLFKLIINEPIPEKKKILVNEYNKMKSYKKKQYLFGFVGLGAAIACPFVGAVLSVESYDDAPILAGLAAGAVVGVTGAIVSGIFKHKRTKQKIEVARLYNE